MPDIHELIDRYFVGIADIDPPSEPEPRTFQGSHVTALIDGENYFSELRLQIESLGNGPTPESNAQDFIHIAGWWLHLLGGDVRKTPFTSGWRGLEGGPTGLDPNINLPPMTLQCSPDAELLIDLLKTKSRAGVDVRVLGFVSAAVMGSSYARKKMNGVGIAENVGTILAVDALRAEPTLADKACLNTVSHVVGTVHTKLIVLGNASRAVGFTGGMDLASNRCGDYLHVKADWHDVQAKVEGPAVQGLYEFFRDLWNEAVAIAREPISDHGYANKGFRIGAKVVASVTPNTAEIPPRMLSEQPVGLHHIQSLRTVPQFNFEPSYALLKLPAGRPLSFAPHGLFEIRTAWRKAILAAQRYIYIEDQFFWSIEVMRWINEAIKAQPELKVILVTGGRIEPGWENQPPGAYTPIAFLEGLLLDLDPTRMDAQIRVFVRDVTLHAKTTLIDDMWTMIGSANCDTRGLYTDVEHDVAVIDELGEFARDYRRDLWGGHFDLPSGGHALIQPLENALNVWNEHWGTSGFASSSNIRLRAGVQRLQLPPAPLVLDEKARKKHERFEEPDSREDWSLW